MRRRSFSIYATDEQDFIKEAKLRCNDESAEADANQKVNASPIKTVKLGSCELGLHKITNSDCNDETPSKLPFKNRSNEKGSGDLPASNLSKQNLSENFSYHLNNDHQLSFSTRNYNLANLTSKTEEELTDEMNQLLKLINSKDETLTSNESDSFICKYFKGVLIQESLFDNSSSSVLTQSNNFNESSLLLHRINSFNSRLLQKERSLSLNSLHDISLNSIIKTVLSEKLSASNSLQKEDIIYESPSKMRRGQHFITSLASSPNSLAKLSFSPSTKSLSDPELINLEEIICENARTDASVKIMLIGREDHKKLLLESIRTSKPQVSSTNR